MNRLFTLLLLHAKSVKFILLGGILLSLFACKEPVKTPKKLTGWTEAQKRKYFADSFAPITMDFTSWTDSTRSYKAFMDKHYPDLKAINKYDPLIYALEEPYIDTTRIDATKHWFRITVDPTFERPYCLVLSQENDKSTLIAKVTNGRGGYHTGTLTLQLKTEYKDTLYENSLKILNEIGFWALPILDTACGPGFDGENWTFELYEGGKYHIIYRHSPEFCGNELTKRLGKMGIGLKKAGKLDKLTGVLDKE